MFGYSLIRTKKLMAIYNKIAIFALEKIRHQKSQKMTFSGIIQLALPEQSGTTAAGKQWRRKDFILLYDNSNAQYPKTVLFSVMGDNIDKLNIQQGVEYDIEIDFSTREYNAKTYMSATAWKATAKSGCSTPPTPTLDSLGVKGYSPSPTPPQLQFAQSAVDPTAVYDDSELPF